MEEGTRELYREICPTLSILATPHDMTMASVSTIVQTRPCSLCFVSLVSGGSLLALSSHGCLKPRPVSRVRKDQNITALGSASRSD